MKTNFASLTGNTYYIVEKGAPTHLEKQPFVDLSWGKKHNKEKPSVRSFPQDSQWKTLPWKELQSIKRKKKLDAFIIFLTVFETAKAAHRVLQPLRRMKRKKSSVEMNFEISVTRMESHSS
ncbi:hypothetical protein CDAR_306681 [Caerostris darwini]|uniref:Ribosomal protein S10 n=1 Tax=Caerostris darwini TaxID=1538125 RepID=A0AAV4SCG1_9ARAC|nr:hypothetical protein CDAR_306681 [Caerostris darwini]